MSCCAQLEHQFIIFEQEQAILTAHKKIKRSPTLLYSLSCGNFKSLGMPRTSKLHNNDSNKLHNITERIEFKWKLETMEKEEDSLTVSTSVLPNLSSKIVPPTAVE